MNAFEEKCFESFESEIKLYYCGKRIHNFSHHYGPYIQDRYLIYYIKEGCADLTFADRKMEISGKGFFVNFPGSRAVYQCVEGSPWSIKWVMVDGEMIGNYLNLLGITKENPYVELEDGREIEDVFDEMYELFDHDTIASKIYCISLVHKLFSLLAAERSAVQSGNHYVSQAWKLIEVNLSDPGFNVAKLSEMLGLHYNYFSILFKKETGESPLRAINTRRFKKACKMLKFTDKPIKEVATDCGFEDELYFSRAFRREFHLSPTSYRQCGDILFHS